MIKYDDNDENKDEKNLIAKCNLLISDKTIKEAYKIMTLSKIDTDLVILINEETKKYILKDIEKYEDLFKNILYYFTETDNQLDEYYYTNNIIVETEDEINNSKIKIVTITTGTTENLLVQAFNFLLMDHLEQTYEDFDIKIKLEIGIGTIVYNSLYKQYGRYMTLQNGQDENLAKEIINKNNELLKDMQKISKKLKARFASDTSNRKVNISIRFAEKSIMKQEDNFVTFNTEKNEILEKCFHLAYNYEKIFSILVYKIFESGGIFKNYKVESLPPSIVNELEHIIESYGKTQAIKTDADADEKKTLIRNVLANPYSNDSKMDFNHIISDKYLEIQENIKKLLKLMEDNLKPKKDKEKKRLRTAVKSRGKVVNSFISEGTNIINVDEEARLIEDGSGTAATNGNNKGLKIKPQRKKKKRKTKEGKQLTTTPSVSSSESDADDEIQDDEIIASEESLENHTGAVSIDKSVKKTKTKAQSYVEERTDNGCENSDGFTEVSHVRKGGDKEKDNVKNNATGKKKRANVSASQKHTTKAGIVSEKAPKIAGINLEKAPKIAGINLLKAPIKEVKVQHRTKKKLDEFGSVTYADLLRKQQSVGNTEPKLTEQEQVGKSCIKYQNLSAITETMINDDAQGRAEGGQKTIDNSIMINQETQECQEIEPISTYQIQQQQLPQEEDKIIISVDKDGIVICNKPLQYIQYENGSIAFTDQRVNDFLLESFAMLQNSNQTSPHPICIIELPNVYPIQQHNTMIINIHPESLLIPAFNTVTTDDVTTYKLVGYVDLPKIECRDGEYVCRLPDNNNYTIHVNLAQPHPIN
ncbi:hypothetical protein BDAP_000253 [Binucleata daphniae]